MRTRNAVAFMSVGTLVSSAASAGAALWATFALPVDDRGIMVIGITIAVMLALLGSMGTNAALRARLGTATGADRLETTRAYTALTLVGALLASIAAAIVCWASAPLIDPRLGEIHLCVAVGIFTAVQTVTAQVSEAWYADGRFLDAAKWPAAAAVCGLAGVIVASRIGSTAASLLVGQSIGVVVGFAGGFYAANRAGLFVLGRPDALMTRALIVEGWPSLGFSVGMPLAMRGDRYLLGIFAGPKAVAIYALAATLGEVPRTVPNAISQVMGRRASERRGNELMTRSIVAALAFAFLTAIAISVVGWFLIPRLFGPEFTDARVYAIWLFAAELAFVPFVLSVRVLLGHGRARWVGTISMAGGVLTCVVTIALVPWAGILGACVASLISYGMLSLVTCRAAYRLDPVEITMPVDDQLDSNPAAP